MGLFDNIGQLGGLLKHAQELQKQVKQMQESLSAQRFDGQSGGGVVTVIVDGRGDLVSIKLSPESVNSGDVEMLEELIKSAVCAAAGKARQNYQQELSKVTGGLELPGLKEMLDLTG